MRPFVNPRPLFQLRKIMNPETASKSSPPRALIAFATYWGSKFGGINSFNADLVEALGLTFYRDMRVFCVVLNADESDIVKAEQSHHVKVISLRRPNDKVFSTDFLEEVKSELLKCGCAPGADTVWLGHDRITGDIAVHAAKQIGGRSALIHHMSYAHYESYAESAPQAVHKEDQQKALFRQADVLLAVGPLLRDALHDLVETEPTMLIPGLQEITPARDPKTFTAFLSGRISEDTHKIKQAQLGVAAFAKAIARANDDSQHLPACLTASKGPCLKVRGLSDAETTPAAGNDPETELKLFAEVYAERVINLRALPFTTNRAETIEELRRASVALMPSWHEGFGLVAWEAIAAGVPLILSIHSGVYRLLDEMAGGIYKTLVFPIDVRGQQVDPYFRPDDLTDVADAIIQIARDPQKARGKASQLREALLQKDCTWKSCARTLVRALGWQPNATPAPLSPVLSVAAETSAVAETAAPESAPPPATDDLLDLPVPQWQPGKGLANSQLLRAEEAVIPFDAAAQPFLDEQLAWAKGAAFPLAARLLIGPGGSGKTRLALQLCTQLQSAGWWSGFLRRPAQFSQIHARLKAGSQPAIIVIDYAETRIDDLFELIRPLILYPVTQPVRILLLARSGGDWWDRLDGRDPQCESFFAGQASSGPYPIPDLHVTPASRETAFQQAIQKFAEKLCLPVPSHSPDLAADHYAHPLLVQMAALLALHDEQPSTAEGLTRSLLNHEKRYWGHLLKDTTATEEQAVQLMALSTLCGGLQTPNEIESIWRKEAKCGTSAQLKASFNRLKILYPHKGGLQSLRPDLLGEALVAQVLLSRQGRIILNAVLGKANENIRHHAWTILARIMRHREDIIFVVESVLASHYSQNAKSAMEVCCQTTSPLPRIMESVYEKLPKSIKWPLARQLEPAFFDDRWPLNDLSLRVSETLLRQARDAFDRSINKDKVKVQANLAHYLVQTSVDHARCGKWMSAMQLAEEAEINYGILAENSSGEFMHEWAFSLNNYGEFLSQNGRLEDALKMTEKSLEIYDGITQLKSVNFESDRASSLNNYAKHLSDNGQYKKALNASKQVLAIYKNLADGSSVQFGGDLARSLHNYASSLSEDGRHEESLKISKEALDIYKRLAQDKPERFDFGKAEALHNYANYLSENGWLEDSLLSAKEALDIYERLAQSKPERFEGDWANELKAYAIHLSNRAHYIKALATIRRGNVLMRKWFEKMPAKYAANYRSGILDELFLTWLCDSIERPELRSDLDLMTIEYTKRERSKVIFHEKCVCACLAVENSEQQAHVKSALSQWSELDAAQQRQYEEMFFLIAAMFEAAAATHPDLPPLPDWHARYEAMVKRRRGNILAWLLDAAKKLGLQLPAVSLTPLAIETSTQVAIQAVDVPDASVLPEHL